MNNDLKVTTVGKRIAFLIGIAIFIFAVGFSAWYIYRDFKKPAESVKVNPNTSPAANSNGGATENQPQIAIPDLDRPINIPENFPADARKIAQEKMGKLVADLKKEPNLFDSWLQLAIYRKMIDDYEGAKEIWEYLTVIIPNDPVAYHNLGDLYGYFLKDNKKAEENFLKALEKGADQIYIYRSVYEFYRFVLKDDARAKQILEQGIKANPNTSQDLEYLLNNY